MVTPQVPAADFDSSFAHMQQVLDSTSWSLSTGFDVMKLVKMRQRMFSHMLACLTDDSTCSHYQIMYQRYPERKDTELFEAMGITLDAKLSDRDRLIKREQILEGLDPLIIMAKTLMEALEICNELQTDFEDFIYEGVEEIQNGYMGESSDVTTTKLTDVQKKRNKQAELMALRQKITNPVYAMEIKRAQGAINWVAEQMQYEAPRGDCDGHEN